MAEFLLHLCPHLISSPVKLLRQTRATPTRVMRDNDERHITEIACRTDLTGAFSSHLQFRCTFSYVVERAFRGADCGRIAAISKQPRNPDGLGELKKFQLPDVFSIHL